MPSTMRRILCHTHYAPYSIGCQEKFLKKARSVDCHAERSEESASSLVHGLQSNPSPVGTLALAEPAKVRCQLFLFLLSTFNFGLWIEDPGLSGLSTSSVRYRQFNRRTRRNPCPAHRRLVNHRTVRPLRRRHVVYFAPHLCHIQPVLRFCLAQPG